VPQPLIFDLQVDNKQAIDSINAFFQIYEKGVRGISNDLSASLGQPVEKKVQLVMENGKAIAREVEVIKKETQQVVDINKALNKEYGKTPGELKRQLRALNALRDNTKKYYDGTKTITKSWDEVSAAIKNVKGQVRDLATKEVGNLNKTLVQSAIEARVLEATFSGIVNGIKNFVSTGADMEVLFLQLEGFTGSVNEASAAYKRFIEIGQATPFTASEIAKGAKVMMGFGVATGDAIDQVERLAVVAAATGGDINNMSRNMGQIVANQRAYTRDLNQFAIQGIPIYKELAKVTGKTGEEVRDMVEAGAIGYDQVSQALKNMTAEGTAFSNIAKRMDATFSAKMEAIGSGLETLAGRFMAFINRVDEVTGGLVSGSMQLLINTLNTVGEGLTALTNNAKQLAPVFGALGGAIATIVGLTIVQNFTQIIAAMKTWKIVTVAQTAATWLLYAAQQALNAATGRWDIVIAGAAVAAGVAAGAAALLGDETSALNQQIEANEEAMKQAGDEAENWGFKMEGLPMKLRVALESMKGDWEAYRGELKQVKTDQADLMSGTAESMKDELQGIKDVIKGYREKQQELRKQHGEEMKYIREKNRTALEAIDEEIRKLQKRHAAELGILDKESAAEKQLAAYRREELELAAKGITFKEDEARLAHKKKLNAQAELDRLDRSKAIANARLRQEKELEAAETRRLQQKKAGEKEENRVLENQKKELQGVKDKEAIHQWYHDNQKQRWEELMAEQEAYFTEEKANSDLSLDEARFRTENMITYEEQVRDAMVSKWQAAKTAMNSYYDEEARRKTGNASKKMAQGNTAAIPAFASGGAIAGGTLAQVNELGKEAFLSASGRLSMINAPAYGKWRAPSDGTIIPAHLTSQLDIPTGGIKINGNAGIAGRSVGGARAAAISHGDSIMNNVTVQSVNPNKTASDMLVSLTKIRRRRMR